MAPVLDTAQGLLAEFVRVVKFCRHPQIIAQKMKDLPQYRLQWPDKSTESIKVPDLIESMLTRISTHSSLYLCLLNNVLSSLCEEVELGAWKGSQSRLQILTKHAP